MLQPSASSKISLVITNKRLAYFFKIKLGGTTLPFLYLFFTKNLFSGGKPVGAVEPVLALVAIKR